MARIAAGAPAMALFVSLPALFFQGAAAAAGLQRFRMWQAQFPDDLPNGEQMVLVRNNLKTSRDHLAKRQERYKDVLKKLEGARVGQVKLRAKAASTMREAAALDPLLSQAAADNEVAKESWTKVAQFVGNATAQLKDMVATAEKTVGHVRAMRSARAELGASFDSLAGELTSGHLLEDDAAVPEAASVHRRAKNPSKKQNGKTKGGKKQGGTPQGKNTADPAPSQGNKPSGDAADAAVPSGDAAGTAAGQGADPPEGAAGAGASQATAPSKKQLRAAPAKGAEEEEEEDEDEDEDDDEEWEDTDDEGEE